MNTSSKPVVAVPILLISVACVQAPPNPYHQAFLAIDRIVEGAMEAAGTPGLALAITSEDELLYEGYYGFADLRHRTPVKETTLFQIGSISKSFTALALMSLMDEGRFNPHRPIEEYLPWWEVRTAYEPITGHHLLTHTAGIPASRDDIPGGRFMVWAQRDQVTAWPPGERFHYSNLGYQTLGVLLVELSGESYTDVIERLILDPLGMDASYPCIEFNRRAQQATGYVVAFDDRPPHRFYPLVEAPYLEYCEGDGSIQSTATDMAAYMRMLMRKGQGPKTRIVSEKAFDAFATAYTSEPLGYDGSWGYGYGIAIASEDSHHFLEHSGGMVGLYANMAVDLDDRTGIVVLVNGPVRWRDIFDYARAALRAAGRGEAPPPIPEPDDQASIGNASEYAGEFTSSSGSTFVVTANDDRVLLQHEGEDLVLERFDEDSFVTLHPDLDRYLFRFGRDNDGEVVELTHGARWFTNRGYGGPTAFDYPKVWSAYTGRYRSYSPWFPYFEILTRKGQLVAVLGNGGETSYDELVLESRGDRFFHPGDEPTPESIHFEDVVDGEALRATWSGQEFFKVSE